MKIYGRNSDVHYHRYSHSKYMFFLGGGEEQPDKMKTKGTFKTLIS